MHYTLSCQAILLASGSYIIDPLSTQYICTDKCLFFRIKNKIRHSVSDSSYIPNYNMHFILIIHPYICLRYSKLNRFIQKYIGIFP